MNRLATSSQKVVHHTPPFGTPLSKQQWAAVKQFKPLVEEWNAFPEVTASDMGRAASKVESVEEVLRCLESEVVGIARDLRSYRGKDSSGPQRALDFSQPVGRVVGRVNRDVAHVAKAVEPEPQAFDPRRFLDERNAQTYADPLAFAEDPADTNFTPARVKVRI